MLKKISFRLYYLSLIFYFLILPLQLNAQQKFLGVHDLSIKEDISDLDRFTGILCRCSSIFTMEGVFLIPKVQRHLKLINLSKVFGFCLRQNLY